MLRINNRLFFLLPLLYVGIFFFLVILQFSKNEQFSQSLGDLSVSGKSSTGQGKDEVVDLNIQGKGITMGLSANTPLLIETVDGTVHKARARSYQVNAGAQTISVNFQHNVQIVLKVAGKVLTISPAILENPQSVRSLSIPLTAQEVPGSGPENLPGMELRAGGQRGFLILSGAGDYIDRSRGYVVVKAEKGWLNPVVLDQTTSPSSSILEAWLFARQTAPSEDTLAASWNEYWSQAFTGWNSDRFTSAGTWDRGGGPGYTPSLGLAYMNESLKRNQPLASLRVPPAAQSFGNSYLDAAYTGNIVEDLKQKRRDMELLQQKLSSGNPVPWSENPLLIRDAFYHGPLGLFTLLKDKLLKEALPVDFVDVGGMLSNLAVLQSLDQSDIQSRTETILVALFKRLTLFQGRPYFVNSRGYLDLLETASTGLALKALGTANNNPQWKLLSAALQSSGLNQSSRGVLPRILITEKGVLLKKEGTLYPEDLYIYQNLLVPGLGDQDLSKYWGKGAFLKTTTAYKSIQVNPEGAFLTFNQAVGGTHTTIIQNLPPFNHIKLHGIRWRPDPQFQIYSDGYFYNEATRTLFVKNTHRSETEVLQILFKAEEPAPLPTP